eukprot:3880317-Amphidinium_carterae.1
MVCSSRVSSLSGARSLSKGARAPDELPADDAGGTALTYARSTSSSPSRRPPLELEGAGGGMSSLEVNSVLCLGAALSSRTGLSSRSSSVPPLRLVSSLYGNFEA